MVFPVELARSAALELVNVLRDTKNNVQSGNPLYLRDGEPDSYIGKLNQATVRQACRKWSSKIGDNPGSDADWDRLCKPYLEDVGLYPGEPTFPPPFTGGQCSFDYDGVLRVTKITGAGDSSFDAAFSNVAGPILGAYFEPQPAQFSIRYGVVTDAGNVFVGATSQTGFQGVAVASVTPSGGQPDDCGNPPGGDYTPPSPTTPAPGPITVDIGVDFEVDIDVEFSPNGDITVIFEPDSPEPTPVPVRPEPGVDTPPEDIGEPGPDETTAPGGEVEGSAEDGEILTGVLIEVVNFPVFANLNTDAGGALFRGAYYCYLGTEGALDLQPEGAIARDVQFYYAPQPATSWRVVSGLGYTTRVTPYYRPAIEGE